MRPERLMQFSRIAETMVKSTIILEILQFATKYLLSITAGFLFTLGYPPYYFWPATSISLYYLYNVIFSNKSYFSKFAHASAFGFSISFVIWYPALHFLDNTYYETGYIAWCAICGIIYWGLSIIGTFFFKDVLVQWLIWLISFAILEFARLNLIYGQAPISIMSLASPNIAQAHRLIGYSGTAMLWISLMSIPFVIYTLASKSFLFLIILASYLFSKKIPNINDLPKHNKSFKCVQVHFKKNDILQKRQHTLYSLLDKYEVNLSILPEGNPTLHELTKIYYRRLVNIPWHQFDMILGIWNNESEYPNQAAFISNGYLQNIHQKSNLIALLDYNLPSFAIQNSTKHLKPTHSLSFIMPKPSKSIFKTQIGLVTPIICADSIIQTKNNPYTNFYVHLCNDTNMNEGIMLAQSQVMAIYLGNAVIRASNKNSAIINSFGQILAKLGNKNGVLYCKSNTYN